MTKVVARGSARWARPLLALAAVGALFVVGQFAAGQIDFDFSLAGLEGARTWVGSFGWLGPAVFVTMLAFRTFLLLPSYLALVLGGLVFGPIGGTLWGAIGLTLCCLLQFGIARVFGDAWFGGAAENPRLDLFKRRIQRAGPWALGLIVSHPAGPLTPATVGAGLGSLPLSTILVAVLVASPVRAATFSVLGASILDWTPAVSIAVAVGLGVVVLLPLAHPGVRATIRGVADEAVGPRI